jgi:hypothetical protein
MNPSDKLFRDRLLATETANQNLKAKYEKDLQMILEHQLSAPKRAIWIGSLILGCCFVLLFGGLAVWSPTELPWLARMGFVLGMFWGAAWVILSVRILRRGALNLRTHSSAAAAITWVFTVFMMTLFLLLSGSMPNKIAGVQMVVNGMVFLIGAAAFLVTTRVEQAELKTREKLLEIEYRLAQMAEKLDRKNDGDKDK